MDTTPSSRNAVHLLLIGLYVLLVMALALGVLIVFLRTSGIGLNGKASIEKMLTGTAYRPYVYRRLLPGLANLVAPQVDGMWALRLGRRSELVLGDLFFRAQLNGRIFPSQVILILAMMYLGLAGYAASMGLLVRDLGYSSRIQYLMPPAALLATTINFNFGYMSDFAELFLFTICLWLIYRLSWVAYLAAFALATLNKETSLLLILIFFVYCWRRLPRRPFLIVGGAQLSIYLAIQAAIRYRFRHNPGAAFEWHLPDQIATFELIFFERPWLLVFWAACVILLAALVIWNWRRKPEFIRSALSPLPILLLLWLLYGYPLETRNLMEILPVVLILVLPPPAGSSLPAGASPHASAPGRRISGRGS